MGEDLCFELSCFYGRLLDAAGERTKDKRCRGLVGRPQT